MIRKLLKKILKKFGFEVLKLNNEKYIYLPKKGLTFSEDYLYTYHNTDFLKDELFINSYQLGKETDKSGMLLQNNDIRWRVYVLCWAAHYASHLKGDFVDCGVNTGIFARAIINYIDFNNTGKKYYLLDTFYGLEPAYSTEKEMVRNKNIGYENQNQLLEDVARTFKDFNVEIIQGAIPDTLEKVATKEICFLSIDMNCVKPEIDAMEYFWDSLVPGGIIILDDYGYRNSRNDQKEAHDKFASSKNTMILTLPTCQGLIIKT